MSDHELVISTTDDRFETDVMTRSQLGLVLVDFWAEWCAPCRMLGPVLEQLAEEYKTQLTLVKANTEENAVASNRFGVSGIPAVFAILDGQVIDSFQGTLPEQAIRTWIDKCLKLQNRARLAQLVEEDPAEAEIQLRALLEEEDSPEDKVLLLQVLHAQQRDEECQELLGELETRGFLEPACEKIKSELGLKQGSQQSVVALQEAVKSEPENYALHLELARSHASEQQFEEALQVALELVQVDRKATGEDARLLMIDVFRVLGDDSDLTRDFRRKLSMALY